MAPRTRPGGSRPASRVAASDNFSGGSDGTSRATLDCPANHLQRRPRSIRGRVTAEIATRLGEEAGISKDDRDRIATEIADDILGHGPLERLLADDSVSEIMV